jgi:gluconolactonase
MRATVLLALLLAAPAAPARDVVPEPREPAGTPAAVVDLATAEGAALVKGQWRYSDARIVEVDFHAAGADGQPSGAPNRAYDVVPHAGGPDFDEQDFETIEPRTLGARRCAGRLCFNWYRFNLTVPEQVGGFAAAGATIVFEASLDDYAEVWVDGELPRRAGQSGGALVAGWNAVNRLVIGRHVKPGQRIQLAVFGANGPLSFPPTNFIWVRLARLLFYPPDGPPGPYAVEPHEVNVEVRRLDPALDEIVPRNAKIHKLADGFIFTEGPVWVPDAASPAGGHLLFSDPNANTIYRYDPAGRGALSVFRHPSGYAGADVAEYGQPGSNGLTFDRQGRLTIDQHGNRRVVRLEADGRETVLADRYQGRRLNSPNDLVYRSNGDLYFTDPPFGLPKFFDDPRKELPWSGVYGLLAGKLRLLSKDLRGPNGIAFSPDEKYLYVGNWDENKKVVVRHQLMAGGTLGPGEVFFDMTPARGEDALDGVKVDQRGNVYVSGPGGLWILSPEGKHLGTIVGSRHAHNFAWGDADGKSLYLCARGGLYRLRLDVAGVRP